MKVGALVEGFAPKLFVPRHFGADSDHIPNFAYLTLFDNKEKGPGSVKKAIIYTLHWEMGGKRGSKYQSEHYFVIKNNEAR